ncbi:glycosyltransferase family 9 protein [Salinisphaera sp. P385]|uniref:Glycosyltransferase family 9 protein n=1 Tax=Spectribacter acetivorans TaxID=3075603 RepID=A0ABU3BAY0_9GAMM|nr:glycosyltransferase family 9 protein [Salinisphaera sp. P385]MDT0619598.1 glycosyltransferase family 9 protein [Salinisphaera sp. P385]
MPRTTGIRALIRPLRQALRRRISRWITRCCGTPHPRTGPLPAPGRILVCQSNSRLGNTLLLIPLLQGLADRYPHARIDVVIKGCVHGSLLQSLPGIGHVHELPARGAAPRAMLKLIRELRRLHYDLAVEANSLSTTNRILLAGCGASHRLGFAGPDQCLRLTHAVALPSVASHSALQLLHLLTALPGRAPASQPTLAVYPDAPTRARAETRLRRALGSIPANRPVIGFFTRATGNKQLPNAWWQQWRAALHAGGDPPLLIEIVPPGGLPVHADQAAVSTTDLMELAALLARLDVFVSADCGPMHLAAAAGIPVVGLFRATPASRFAPLGNDCISLDEPLHPVVVARETVWRYDRRRDTRRSA